MKNVKMISGPGLTLGFRLSVPDMGASGGIQPAVARGTISPPDFLHIDTNGNITIVLNKSEMGQGVYTAMPMLIAEELECDWTKVRVVSAPVRAIYNNPMIGMQMTGGSLSVRTEWDRLRMTGAAAREMLLQAAADTWKVKKSSCHTYKGIVTCDDGRALSYGDLAEKAARLPVPSDIPLKDPSAYTLLGKPTACLDTPQKVDGSALYSIDVKTQGMLTALVARPPVFGGKVKSFNADKAKQTPGVRDVVEIDEGVAVVADTFWQAKKGINVLEIVWADGSNASLSTDGMREEYARHAGEKCDEARRDGDADAAISGAATRIEAIYEVPFLAHACMEPLNCAVDPERDPCEVWVGTQAQTLHRADCAKALGVGPESVALHTTFLGGGFGRRGNPHSDFVVMAAQVARAAGKPVKVIWTREDDMKGGYFRPFWYSKFVAGLDGSGRIVGWHHTSVGQSIMKGTVYEDRRVNDGIDMTSVEGAADIPYEIPNILVELFTPAIDVPVQWWRSVGHSHSAFMVESFIDEAAYAAGKDPFEFRRELLKEHPRHRAVLELAAEKAGWGRKLESGEGMGIAVHESYGSLVSEVAVVSVSDSGAIRVHEVTCAIDCGQTVNPATIEAQMESGIVFGLSAALYGEITLESGRVRQSNFNDYPVLRMSEMPVIKVYIAASTEPPGGVGEPGVPPIAPAVTNALFAATGQRIRKLPLRGAEPR